MIVIVTRLPGHTVDNMKHFLCLGLLALLGLVGARAQVVVEVTLEQTEFLPGEALPATVRIINRSGRALHLGADADWLTFAVQARDGSVVRKNGAVPVVGAFRLENAEVGSKTVDLAPHFLLTRPGRYNVSAAVRLKDWSSTALSPPKNFDVIEGTKIWSQEFGVPSATHSNQPPEVRVYSLLQANYLRSELRLYFSLTDAAGTKVLKVAPLGRIVSFGQPQAEVDRESRLHVLHQNGAHTSLHTVMSPEGEIVFRHHYEYTQVRPRLVMNSEGKIVVGNGVRRLDKNDLPPLKTAE